MCRQHQSYFTWTYLLNSLLIGLGTFRCELILAIENRNCGSNDHYRSSWKQTPHVRQSQVIESQECFHLSASLSTVFSLSSSVGGPKNFKCSGNAVFHALIYPCGIGQKVLFFTFVSFSMEKNPFKTVKCKAL